MEKKKLPYKVGVGLIITSFLIWLIPFIAPFTPLPTQIKAGLIAGGIIVAEILFWLGVLLVGKEAAAKLKRY